jgi:hypothetical protein
MSTGLSAQRTALSRGGLDRGPLTAPARVRPFPSVEFLHLQQVFSIHGQSECFCLTRRLAETQPLIMIVARARSVTTLRRVRTNRVFTPN